MKNRDRGQAGQVLIEVLISAVLVGLAGMLVVTVVSSVPKAQGQFKQLDSGMQAALSVHERLKNYVSADTAVASLGPGGSWQLEGDMYQGSAVAEGTEHTVSAADMPADLKRRGATLTYTILPARDGVQEVRWTVRWPRGS